MIWRWHEQKNERVIYYLHAWRKSETPHGGGNAFQRPHILLKKKKKTLISQHDNLNTDVNDMT